jgi:HlyD family secretion protein
MLAYVRAPRAGEILKIHTKDGEIIGSKGIVEMGQTDQMYAVAEVYETDITRIKTGQSVMVTSEALSDMLRGKVVHIGRLVSRQSTFDSNPTADSDARVVEVKISLDAASSQKAKGLTNQRIRAAITI